MARKNNGNGLTAKRQIFAQLVAIGNTATAAYKEAFNAQNMSAGAIHTEAYRLMKIPQIALTIREAQVKLGKELGWDGKRLIEENANVYSQSYTEGDWTAATASLRELAKLTGAYEDITPQMPDIQYTEILQYNDFSKLTPEQLRGLAGLLRAFVTARRGQGVGSD